MKTKITTYTTSFLADMETPVGIYLKIRDIYAESALLESSDYHSKENSYSFIGVEPIATYKLDAGVVEKKYPCGHIEYGKVKGRQVEAEARDGKYLPISFQEFMDEFDIQGNNSTNVNGFFGYTSYEGIRYFDENANLAKGDAKSSNVPDFYYSLYRFIIVINHISNELSIVENVPGDSHPKTNELIDILRNNDVAHYTFSAIDNEKSTMTDEQHAQIVQEGIALCKSGKLEQIVLSRGFSQKFKGDEFNVYRALRSINPSPYLFFFDFGDFRIFGSSPETHSKVSNGRAYIDPIAGTYKRTGNDMKDKELSETLLNDDKEVEEHDMLVDFAKKDLEKNCTDVKVEFYKNVQFYSHVIHLVSRVSGKVKNGINSIKVYADTFPAGTLVGSPKLDALNYIADLEQSKRGFYGGCIGYIGFNGDLNQAITIRTFLSKGNTLYYQAGGGIVAKSKIENEVQEVKNKLAALKKAIDTATNIKY